MERELLKEFVKLGDKFTQMGFNEQTQMYLYKRVLSCGVTYYEVFRRKLRVGVKYNSGKEYEVYPSDENFGVWAKCCSNYESAKRYFDNGI